MILPRHEFMRIVQHSRVITKEERERMEAQAKKEKEMAMVRKRYHIYLIKKVDSVSKTTTKMNLDYGDIFKDI